MGNRIARSGMLGALLAWLAWSGARAEGEAVGLVTRSFQGTPLAEAVRSIQEEAKVTVVVDPSLQNLPLTLDLVALSWQDALRVLAEQARGVLEHGSGDSWRIVPMPRVSYTTGPEGLDIRQVIDAIGTQVRANIVVAPDVQGSVILQLHDMPWKDALVFAVRSAGTFSVVEEMHGVLRIVRSNSLQTQLVTQFFPLRYLHPPADYQGVINTPYALKREYTGPRNALIKEQASSIEDFSLLRALRSMLTPDVGTIEYDEGSNGFIVTDIPPKLSEIRRLLDELDREPRQVFVDVKFVATENTDFLDFGVDWGGALNTGPLASINGGTTFTKLPFNPGYGGLLDDASIRDEGPTANDVNNFLSADNEDFPHAFTFGTLDFSQVAAVLRFIKRDVRARVIQAPQITAQDNVPATIFVGEIIRYAETRATANEAGGLEFSLAEAGNSPVNTGFQLLIHPHIIEQDNTIQMTVIPERDTLSGTSTTQSGFDTFSDGTNSIDLPRISSQTLVTNVILESGQTVVLGGLLEFSEVFEDTRIPLLGNIPILGYAFRNKNRLQTVENLLIFITPRIISSSQESRRALEETLARRNASLRQEFGERLHNATGE
ncbi:MAG: hypothetical protein HY608_07805 [Planctomycetes bacterium]|nr:hypothetical protein [Planctomycetota bacterium]